MGVTSYDRVSSMPAELFTLHDTDRETLFSPVPDNGIPDITTLSPEVGDIVNSAESAERVTDCPIDKPGIGGGGAAGFAEAFASITLNPVTHSLGELEFVIEPQDGHTNND